MSRFTTKTCHTCGEIEFEDKMLEYNDHFFCGIRCKLTQERKEDAKLTSSNTDRAQYRAFGRSRQQSGSSTTD